MIKEEEKKMMDELREKYIKMPLVDLSDPENFEKMVKDYLTDLEKTRKRVGIKYVDLKKSPRYKRSEYGSYYK